MFPHHLPICSLWNSLFLGISPLARLDCQSLQGGMAGGTNLWVSQRRRWHIAGHAAAQIIWPSKRGGKCPTFMLLSCTYSHNIIYLYYIYIISIYSSIYLSIYIYKHINTYTHTPIHTHIYIYIYIHILYVCGWRMLMVSTHWLIKCLNVTFWIVIALGITWG